MTGPIKCLSCIILLSTLFGAQAQTINAASCSSTDVQNALNAVSADGTTVSIPAEECTWTTPVIYNQAYSTTIQGATTITGACAPGGTCTATDGTTLVANGTLLSVNTAAGKSFRMTGLTINTGGAVSYGTINVSGASKAVRFDHNHINDLVNGGHVFQTDSMNGVFDHNVLESTTKTNSFMIQVTDRGASGYGNEAWTKPTGFGGSNFVFFENNLIQGIAFAYDCDRAGKIVLRYNIVGLNTKLQTHGTGAGDTNGRSCRAEELYGNTFTYSNTPDSNSAFAVLQMEGGSGMYWNNTTIAFSGLVAIALPLNQTSSSNYSQEAPPNGWGYCNATPINGIAGPSPWMGGTGANDSPCVDQIGRGAGDLLTGVWPNKVNSTTGTITWPHQVLEPAYAWGNTLNPNAFKPLAYWGSGPNTIENVDFYVELPNVNNAATFNGTAGVGCGPSNGVGCAHAVARPASCTAGVGYWNVSEQRLYQCAAGNVWNVYYTPYTYPHPLTGGTGGGSSFGPPTSLHAVVN